MGCCTGSKRAQRARCIDPGNGQLTALYPLEMPVNTEPVAHEQAHLVGACATGRMEPPGRAPVALSELSNCRFSVDLAGGLRHFTWVAPDDGQQGDRALCVTVPGVPPARPVAGCARSRRSSSRWPAWPWATIPSSPPSTAPTASHLREPNSATWPRATRERDAGVTPA